MTFGRTNKRNLRDLTITYACEHRPRRRAGACGPRGGVTDRWRCEECAVEFCEACLRGPAPEGHLRSGQRSLEEEPIV